MADDGVVVWCNPRCSKCRGADELLDAMTKHPELIERPVVIWADRAVVARPPELLLPLLAAHHDSA